MTRLLTSAGLKPSTWSKADGAARNHDAHRYTPDAIVTLDGVAIVTAVDPAGGYTSGELDTPFNYGPGTYTARIRMPKTPAAGIGSAFWMVNNHAAAPVQEVDIAEWYGDDPTQIRCNYIWGYDDWHRQNASVIDLGVDLSADFHDYALTWTRKALTWWFDGRVVKTFTDADAKAAGVALPTGPLRVVLGSGVGSAASLGGAPKADTILPATFNIASVTA